MRDLTPASPDPLSRLGVEALRPEARLLLRCVGSGRGVPDSEALGPLLGKELDWGWLAETARLHAVLPLVHRRLLAVGVDRPELRDLATGVALRNLRLTSELLGIGQEFEAHGIRMLAWKGPALAVLAWGDITLREFRDLDLVVFPEDYEPAAALLSARGYRPEATYTGVRAKAAIRRACETLFRGPAGHRIDLHWRFSAGRSASRLSVSEVWGRRQEVLLGHRRVAAPGTGDLLLSLTEHGAKHAWERLSWLGDIGRLAIDARLDWEMLLAEARALGSERMLLLGLLLAGGLLGADVPPAARRRWSAHPQLAGLAEWVVRRLFAGAPGHLRAGERRAFQLRGPDHLRDRVWLAAGMLLGVGEGDWRAVRLPDRLHLLYYLIRPFRLAWRYGSELLGGLVRR